jgi:hypothetical protein
VEVVELELAPEPELDPELDPEPELDAEPVPVAPALLEAVLPLPLLAALDPLPPVAPVVRPPLRPPDVPAPVPPAALPPRWQVPATHCQGDGQGS